MVESLTLKRENIRPLVSSYRRRPLSQMKVSLISRFAPSGPPAKCGVPTKRLPRRSSGVQPRSPSAPARASRYPVSSLAITKPYPSPRASTGFQLPTRTSLRAHPQESTRPRDTTKSDASPATDPLRRRVDPRLPGTSAESRCMHCLRLLRDKVEGERHHLERAVTAARRSRRLRSSRSALRRRGAVRRSSLRRRRRCRRGG
jgi:hypothetical protein